MTSAKRAPADRIKAARRDLSELRAELTEALSKERTRKRGPLVRMYFYLCTRIRFPKAMLWGLRSIPCLKPPLTRQARPWPNAMIAMIFWLASI